VKEAYSTNPELARQAITAGDTLGKRVRGGVADEGVLVNLISSLQACGLGGVVPLLSSLFLDSRVSCILRWRAGGEGGAGSEEEAAGGAGCGGDGWGSVSKWGAQCALAALKVLTNVALIDLRLLQRILGSVTVQAEFSHIALQVWPAPLPFFQSFLIHCMRLMTARSGMRVDVRPHPHCRSRPKRLRDLSFAIARACVACMHACRLRALALPGQLQPWTLKSGRHGTGGRCCGHAGAPRHGTSRGTAAAPRGAAWSRCRPPARARCRAPAPCPAAHALASPAARAVLFHCASAGLLSMVQVSRVK
jgi:hypothetical protein